jgi:type II secretory pathway pseudopilin PulG
MSDEFYRPSYKTTLNSFIEQKGGDRIVQHLIMLGTPNGGSPWSTVQDWATAALTIGLNGLSVSGFPLAALGNLLRGIEAIDINLDRMKPKSDFLTSLADCADPGIPYTILAGNTSLIPPPDEATANKLQTLLEKLGRGAIEFPFLGQPNDIAVTVNSIKNVPQGRNISWRWRIAIAVISILSVLTIATRIGWNEATRQGIAAEQQLLKAESESAQLLYSSGLGFDALMTSPDGKTLASASGDRTVKLWNSDRTFRQTLDEHTNKVYSVAFSPDGKTIASVSGDTTVKLWNPDGTLLQIFQGHKDGVYDISFSPDSQTIASASVDGTVRLWQRNGISRQTFQEHQGDVYDAVFSPNGDIIASASHDRTIKL